MRKIIPARAGVNPATQMPKAGGTVKYCRWQWFIGSDPRSDRAVPTAKAMMKTEKEKP